MSLSNVKVKFTIDKSGWRDSLHYRPSLQDEIWICNGEGGPVSPARYVGAEAGCYHGLYGACDELRDDHYFWMPRPPGVPPATRTRPARTDGWISVKDQSPTNGQQVWAAEANGVVFLSTYYDAIQKGAPGFYTYEDNGTHDRTVYWMLIKSHKPAPPSL